MGGKFQWPKLSDVVDFRRKVKHVVLGVIDKTPLQLPITQDSPWVSAFSHVTLTNILHVGPCCQPGCLSTDSTIPHSLKLA